ncbi:MAG: copper chaperone PCu(A)C [Burkholderiaceae bacterium]
MLSTTKFIAAYALLTGTIGIFSIPISAKTLVEVKIDGAWVRPAVPGQKGTGGFMQLTAQRDLRLVGISSPVAGVSEVHEMKMQGDMMQMRAIPYLELPAGKTVELKPGGYHLMLMDLKQALPKDTKVPMTLRFKDKAGKELTLNLQVPVSSRAPTVSAPAASAPAASATAANAQEHKHNADKH